MTREIESVEVSAGHQSESEEPVSEVSYSLSAEILFHGLRSIGYEDSVQLTMTDGREVIIDALYSLWEDLFGSEFDFTCDEEGQLHDKYPEFFWQTEIKRRRGWLNQDFCYFFLLTDKEKEDEEKVVFAEGFSDKETVDFFNW